MNREITDNNQLLPINRSDEDIKILSIYENSKKYNLSQITKFIANIFIQNKNQTESVNHWYEQLKQESLYARICFHRQYQNQEFINRLKFFHIKEVDIKQYAGRTYPKIKFTRDKKALGGSDTHGSYTQNENHICILSMHDVKDPFGVSIHECIHYLTNSTTLYLLNPMLAGYLKNPFYQDFAQFHVNATLDHNEIIQNNDILDDYSSYKEYFEYKLQHQELHAELGRLRAKISPLNPRTQVTEYELFIKIDKYLQDTTITNSFKFFLAMIDRSKSKEFTQLYNTFF